MAPPSQAPSNSWQPRSWVARAANRFPQRRKGRCNAADIMLRRRRWLGIVNHLSNAHRNRGDPADNFCFVRVPEMSDMPTRLWTRNQDQLVSVQFAPTASVSIPKFDEIDGAIEFIFPSSRFYFVLTSVDLYKRTWSDEGEKSVIFEPNVATKAMAKIQLLQKSGGNLTPCVKHLKTRPDQVGVLQAD